jgi:RimJ/RimL family protein N-acetyltransferase
MLDDTVVQRLPARDREQQRRLACPVATDEADALVHVDRDVGAIEQRVQSERELRIADAASLLAMLSTEEVARFISPPPTTIEGFERFIAWTQRERAAGNYACFAVVPHGMDSAIGIFQVRQLEPGFGTAEWGFAIGSAFWGTGVFMDGARLVIDFAFDVIGTHRLEARAAILNGRGNGALRKVGAMQEGILRKSFLRNGEYLDQALWTILDEDWRQQRVVWGAQIH